MGKMKKLFAYIALTLSLALGGTAFAQDKAGSTPPTEAKPAAAAPTAAAPADAAKPAAA
jgi:hypothetical protein